MKGNMLSTDEDREVKNSDYNDSKEPEGEVEKEFSMDDFADASKFNDKIDDLKQKVVYNQYFFYGNEDNIFINKGKVEGGVGQEINSSKKDGDSSKVYDFQNETEIREFITAYQNKLELLDFICVIYLKFVPIYLREQIREKLEACLFKLNEEDSAAKAKIWIEFSKEQELLQIEEGTVVQKGRADIECIFFRDDKLRIKIKAFIWNQYWGMREPILKWLMDIKEDQACNDKIFVQIADAIAEIALIDSSYVFSNMLQNKANENKWQDRNFTVRILSYYIQNHVYDKNLDIILKDWLWKGSKKHWAIVYRLYHKNIMAVGKYRFIQEVEKCFEKYLYDDMRMRCLGNGIILNKKNDYIDLFPAYYNEEITGLIIKTLYKIFADQKSFEQKKRFGEYFFWVMVMDFKIEGYPSYEMLLLKGLRERPLRNKVKEMYREYWRQTYFRRLWTKLLDEHLAELDYRNSSWIYAKDFFVTLAFTGKKDDFDLMIKYLSRFPRNRLGKKIADEIKSLLVNLKQERERDYNNDY